MKSATRKTTLVAPQQTAPKPEVKAFEVVVGPGEAIGDYKEGDPLTTDRVIDDFFRQHIAARDPEAFKRLADVNPSQLVAVVKATKVDDLDPDNETANGLRLEAILEAPFMLTGTEDIPSQRQLKTSGAYSGLAATYGRMVDAQTQGVLSTGIKGQIDADSCPIVTCQNLERQFMALKNEDGEPVMNLWPPIGSKYRGPNVKGNKAPDGYRRPDETNLAANDPRAELPIWNGPWDTYKVTPVNAPDYDAHWLAEFTSSTTDGAFWAAYVDCVKDALANVTAEEGYRPLDDETVKRVATLKKQGTAEDKAELESLLKEAAFQYNRRKAWYGKAITLHQAKQKIEDRFSIHVELAGERLAKEAPAIAARRRSPFLLVTEVPSESDPRKVKDVFSNPQTLSFVLGLAKKAHTMPGNTTIPKLTEKKRGRKTGAATAETSKAPAIENINQFQNTLSEIWGYVKAADKSSLILARCNDPKEGPEFCSAICHTFDAIHEVVMTKGVREKAIAYDEAVSEASGERATAKVA